MIVRLNSLLFTIFFITMHAWAQSGSNAQNTLLPEINPQDIEIRSEFRAKFSGLRRQPILGFDPKPPGKFKWKIFAMAAKKKIVLVHDLISM